MPPFDFDPDESMRIQSPRPETPEPDARQGRRNLETGVQLLDDEGAISEKVHDLEINSSWRMQSKSLLVLLS